ncbi:hypothetical protein C8R45DRAFT_156183 [Mycena sanguinolenta]|nr:hypothetical protein C8R45DRAFT_156183 [Mycena sanguinolenta]
MGSNDMENLPTLTALPLRHPSSCASLSLPLLDLLDAVLPPASKLTLSVGSGTGLLEALLLSRHPHRVSPTSFLGIEVAQPRPVNRFLPPENAAAVLGTWAVAPDAERAEGLMFVYPRQPGLVRAYLERGTSVRTVVWIGPRCDVDDFVDVLREWGEEEDQAARVGGPVVEDGEMMLVFRRRMS